MGTQTVVHYYNVPSYPNPVPIVVKWICMAANIPLMAGPDCKFSSDCQNISTQPLAIFQRLGDVQTRVIAVDERMGIVWLRMAWGVRERGGDQLTVWETFKVYDGKIHAVEAFMRILPVEKRNGGWE